MKTTRPITKLAAALAALLITATLTVNAADKPLPYPLKTCIVSDNDLNSMGGPVTKIHKGQEVKFCCKPCVAKFKKNPGKYLSRIPAKGG